MGRRNSNKNNSFLIYLSLISTLVWIFALAGYMRYALVIPILYLCVLSCALLEIKNVDKKLTYITLALIAFITPLPKCQRYTYGRDFSNFLKDKNATIHIDGVWGVIDDNSFLTSMVREEGTPIYNLNINQNSTSELTAKMTKEKIEGKEFYLLADNMLRWYYFDEMKYLAMNGYEVVDFIRTYNSTELPYLAKWDTAYLYKVKYTGNFPEEPIYEAKSFFPLNNPDY